MGLVADLVKDALKTGPDNVKRLVSALDHLPKDETLLRGIDLLEKLEPHLPALQTAMKNGLITKLEKLTKNVPDKKTLDRLIELAPLLERIPDQATLNKLLDKTEDLKAFIDSLEEET